MSIVKNQTLSEKRVKDNNKYHLYFINYDVRKSKYCFI